ncbi:MAG TPA: ABC transporter permease [Beutenbergiaceae bacterium]|nr:ABC transporter permease [Beutenbergiaceae bacterium]
MMRGVITMEATTMRASRVVAWTSAIVVVGVIGLTLGFVAATLAGNEQVASQLGPLATQRGWPLFLGVMSQLSAAGCVIGFGVGLSWIFGHEFTDRTLSGLFAHPVSLARIAGAKLSVYGVWVVGVASAVCLIGAGAGWVTQAGALTGEAMAGFARLWILIVLSGCLATPAAWAATLGRGPFPGIGATIGVVIIGQIGSIGGLAGWVPFVAPALWALNPAEVSLAQLALTLTIPAVFGGLTIAAWQRLTVD